MEVHIKDSILEFLPNTIETIRNRYNLDKGRMVQSVDILDDWVQKQNHFMNKNFSRRYLEITIIACKGSVEKAKKQLDKLCTYRTLLPKFFISSDVKTACEIVNDSAYLLVLPKMTKNYQRAIILKIKNKSFNSSDFTNYFRVSVVLSEYIKARDYCDGFTIIEDLRDVNLVNFFTSMNLIEYQQYMTILTEGFGTRIKGIHIISQSKAVGIFISTIKSALTEKISNRLHVHPEIEDVYQFVEREILPVEYGGEERSIEELTAEWTKILSSEETEKYLTLMKKSGTDESKRQTDEFNEQYMGLPGSFRTLTVD